MKSLLILIALVLTAFVNAEVKEEENVLILTTDNFEEVTEGHQYILVEFCEFNSVALKLVVTPCESHGESHGDIAFSLPVVLYRCPMVWTLQIPSP